jgi:hypothetical protein
MPGGIDTAQNKTRADLGNGEVWHDIAPWSCGNANIAQLGEASSAVFLSCEGSLARLRRFDPPFDDLHRASD